MNLGAFVLEPSDLELHEDLLRQAGVDRLVFPFDTAPHIVERARRHFRIFLEFKPFMGSTVENVFGERKALDALGCPNDREVRGRNLEALMRRLEETIVDGVILDFVRFPSPANGPFFWSCFCSDCKKAADALGYDLEESRTEISGMLGEDQPRHRDRPTARLSSPKSAMIGLRTLAWCAFKSAVITEYVREWAEAVSEAHKGAFVFSPSIAFLVGQDYRAMSALLDSLHPMIYPEGSLGPACLGFEIAALADGLGGDTAGSQGLQEMYDLLGLANPTNPGDLGSLRAQGLPDEVIREETESALALSSEAKVEPIITVVDIPPPRVVERIRFALDGGAEGVYLFGFAAKYRQGFAALGESVAA
jgi:hypothetical protein